MFSAILGTALILTMIFNGFTTSVGASMHDELRFARPSPLGIIRVETNVTGNARFVAQHISSIPDAGDNNSGINSIGVEFTANMPGLLTKR